MNKAGILQYCMHTERYPYRLPQINVFIMAANGNQLILNSRRHDHAPEGVRMSAKNDDDDDGDDEAPGR